MFPHCQTYRFASYSTTLRLRMHLEKGEGGQWTKRNDLLFTSWPGCSVISVIAVTTRSPCVHTVSLIVPVVHYGPLLKFPVNIFMPLDSGERRTVIWTHSYLKILNILPTCEYSISHVESFGNLSDHLRNETLFHSYFQNAVKLIKKILNSDRYHYKLLIISLNKFLT